MALTAQVICPLGVTGEVQFAVKRNGDYGWTKLPGFSTKPVAWRPPSPGVWLISATARAVRGSTRHDLRADPIVIQVAVPGAPIARADAVSTRMSTPIEVDLGANDTGDLRVITGFTQGSRGRVTVSGTVATYTPSPGFSGRDGFRYTVSDRRGRTSTTTAMINIMAADPVCSISISAPSSTTIGPPLRVTAAATCDIGVPEVQWLHRPPGRPFSVFKQFSADLTADFSTANHPIGTHQFFARVRSRGTTETFASNVVNVAFVAGVSCTAVVLNEPTSGAVFRSGQAIPLRATASCPAGVTPEYQFRVRVPGAADWMLLGSYGGSTSSHTPTRIGDWELSAIARAVGSSAAFQVQSAPATVTVGDAPIAREDALELDEDTTAAVNVLANDTDPNHDPLTATIVSGPTSGAATINAGVVTYTPVANFQGGDALTYRIDDGHGGTAEAKLHITVHPINDAPVAVDDALTTAEDSGGSIDVVLNDTDVDGDALTVTAITAPQHGIAAVSGTVISYSPATDFSGSDTLSYTISDGRGGTATATLAITVIAVNDPGTAVDDELTAPEDGQGTVSLVENDIDPENETLRVVEFTQPGRGSVAVVDGIATYVPEANYNGTDAFTYTVEDSGGARSTADVLVTVLPVNDAPEAFDDATMLEEDGAVTVAVGDNDRDIDRDVLTVTAITQPEHGSAEITSGHEVRYTPAANFFGTDQLTYTISDPSGAAATATLFVVVLNVNDTPVAEPDNASLDQNTSITLDVVTNDRDPDEDPLTITAVTQPEHGAVVIVDARRVQYTPIGNYSGPDGFSYTISDPAGATATATVAIEVASVNDAPRAEPDSATLDEDASVIVDVVANDFDADLDELSITSITQPEHGFAIALDAHRVQYTPTPDYNGSDALSYTISDGNGGTATATVSFTVRSINDAPVAAPAALALDEDTTASVDVVDGATDADRDPLSVAGITQPEHGTAVILDGRRVQYTPEPNYHGADSLRFTLDDGNGGMATETLTIAVASVNDAPVAVADTAVVDEDLAITLDVVANDSDADRDTLAITALTAPAHGTVAQVDGQHVTYTPDPQFHGDDAFSYTIDDGHGATATATVSLTVLSVNDAPTAAGVAASTFDDTPVTITFAGSDIENDPLSFAIATPPANGTLGPITGATVSYTPAPGFTGSDSFSYIASDGAATSAPATVLISVIQSVCGNGAREGVHEECDDGNTAPADGCEANCRLTCGSGTGADRATVDLASGRCFAAYDDAALSYHDAAALCGGFGGHLPTLTSALEDAAAYAAVGSGDAPWIGGDDIAIEGTFGWTTGEPLGYTHYAPGKPDGAGDCLQLQSDGAWSDAACGGAPTVRGALCEFELATATPSFAAGGAGARAVVLADLNGDGHADIATANQAGNSVGVLLGNGAGGYALRGAFPAGTAPLAVASGDFDGDGDRDLVTLGSGNLASILRGTGDGGYVAGGAVTIAGGARSVAAADINGDGAIDFAVAATSAVQVFRGNGAGGFTELVSLPLTAQAESIAAGDFNRDGNLDLVVTTSPAIRVYLATAPGVFGAPATLTATTANRAIAVADVDGDGNADLTVAHGTTTATVYFGTETGAFGTPVTLTVTASVAGVATGDFDGDGARDVAALTGGYATMFRRTGRTFAAVRPIAVGAGATAVAAGALNGDAAHDLVVVAPSPSSAQVLLGGIAGLTGAPAVVPGGANGGSVAGDFNEDGRLDLAVTDGTAGRVYIYLQTASGALALGQTITINAAGLSNYPVIADFNRDNNIDLAYVNVAFSSIGIALGNGNGTFQQPFNVGTSGTPGRIAVGDFNGDGAPDIASPSGTSNVVTILQNTGVGTFGRLPDVTQPAGAFTAVVVGDFNRDNRADLAYTASNQAGVRVQLGNGNGSFGTSTTYPIGSGSGSIASGDLNGDGILDLAATNTTGGSVSILRGAGNGTFGAAQTVTSGTQPTSVIAVDFDGDLRRDLVVTHAGSGDVVVLHNDSAGGFVPSRLPVGGAPVWVTAADLDRDGWLDLAVSSNSDQLTTLLSPR